MIGFYFILLRKSAVITMTFEEYLKKKKINPDAFKAERPDEYKKLKDFFDGSGEANFNNAKKFIINQIRRDFHLK